MDCVNIADGFSLALALTLAWIPACFYVWICSRFWFFYHTKITKQITADYKNDIITRILSCGVLIHLVTVLLFLVAIYMHKADLINIQSFGWIYYFTLRPLFIPIEIFVY
jgi:hypothetical protein